MCISAGGNDFAGLGDLDDMINSLQTLKGLSLENLVQGHGEIAHALVIALSTVKTHTNSIFGKLGVTSRTQAVARARELPRLNFVYEIKKEDWKKKPNLH